MDSLFHFLQNLHSVDGLRELIRAGGMFFLIAVIFAETGLLLGFFLPGDSLLVTAGIFAAGDGLGGPGIFNIYWLLFTLSVAAIVGDQLGYYLGYKTGPAIFKREESLFFKRRYVEEAKRFYAKHGKWAIVLARFVPILRTFVPYTAGVGCMPYGQFWRYNIFGGLLWIFSMTLLGYFLGKSPLADEVHKIILIVVFISILPLIAGAIKAWRRK